MNTSPRTLRLFLASVGLGAVLAAGAAGAGVARADAETIEEIAFITVLDNAGITYISEDAAIEAGHAVCDARYDGAGELVIALTVADATGLDAFDAGYFVGAAEGAFCPDMSAVSGTAVA